MTGAGTAADRPEIAVSPRRRLLPIQPHQLSLQVQTTTSCNASCAFCPHPETWGRQPARCMAESTFERILDEVAPFEFYKVAPYLQSEPLADPRIFGLVRRMAATLRFDVLEISTNPGVLSAANARRLCETLAGIPHEVRLSFHGIDAPSLEAAMGLDFEPSLRNTVRFLKEAEAAGVRVVVKALGAPRLPVSRPRAYFTESAVVDFWREVCRREDLDFGRLEIRFGLYHSRSDNLGRPGATPGLAVREDLAGFSCSRADRWLHFLHDGSLVLCCNDYRAEVVLGNVVRDDLRDILSSPALQLARRMVAGLEPSPPDFLCKRCTSPGG